MKRKFQSNDHPSNPLADMVIEMVIFDALCQSKNLTGYNKNQILLLFIKFAQEWLNDSTISY